MILNLGVIDLPYAGDKTVTTVEVAKILEDKYGVMSIFADIHGDDIAKALEESIAGALDNVLMGQADPDPFAQAETEIEALFKFDFLESGEIEGIAPNTPTQAAINRASLRFKKGAAKNDRPSFIDTSTYENSFKAWIEE